MSDKRDRDNPVGIIPPEGDANLLFIILWDNVFGMVVLAINLSIIFWDK